MAVQAKLPRAVKGGVRPSPLVTWVREDTGEPEDLTGAALSGTITDAAGTERAIAGSLTVLDGAAGKFVWSLAPADVAQAGSFEVRITASFEQPPSPAKSFAAPWKVVK